MRKTAIIAIGLMCLMTLSIVAPVASAANTATWTFGLPMGAARTQALVVQDTNGVVYIMGGAPGSYFTDGNCYAFNPGTGTWASIAGTGYLTRASVGDIIDGKIYLLTGWRDVISAVNPITQIYDIAGNSWSYGADIPEPVYEAKSFTYGDCIFVVGGLSAVDNFENSVQIYNVTSDSWTVGANMPKGLKAGATVTVGGYGYYIGGENVSGLVADVYRYDIVHDSWTQKASLPAAIAGNIAIVGQDGLIYSIGGANQFANWPGTAYGNTSAYDIESNSWTICDELNIPRERAGAALYDNKVIVLGGNDDVALTATVEMLDMTQSQMYQTQKKIDLLNSKLAAANTNITSLESQLAASNAKNAELEQDLLDLQEALNQTESDLNSAIDAANNNANSKAGDAQTAADSANMMALIGIIVGIIGIVIAIVAVMMAMKKGKGPQQMVPQQGQVQQ